MQLSNYPRGRVFSSEPPVFRSRPFTLSQDLIRESSIKNLNSTLLLKLMVIIVVAACLIPLLAGTPDNLWFVAGFAILFCLALFAVMFGIIALQQRRFARNRINAPLLDDTRVVVSSTDGIRQTLQCGVDSFIPWTVISRVSVKPKWVEFWFMTGTYFLVPVEAFENVQIIEQIRAFAEREALTAKLK